MLLLCLAMVLVPVILIWSEDCNTRDRAKRTRNRYRAAGVPLSVRETNLAVNVQLSQVSAISDCRNRQESVATAFIQTQQHKLASSHV